MIRIMVVLVLLLFFLLPVSLVLGLLFSSVPLPYYLSFFLLSLFLASFSSFYDPFQTDTVPSLISWISISYPVTLSISFSPRWVLFFHMMSIPFSSLQSVIPHGQVYSAFPAFFPLFLLSSFPTPFCLPCF